MDLQHIREEILGGQKVISTPYGQKVITYGDYTASGRSLVFVEEYMMKIAESYANTHTEDCFLGRQTTKLYHEAKNRIRTLLKASEDYIVLSVGSGTTGAIQRLAQILGIYETPATRIRYGLESKYYDANRPIIFVSPYEHHSNELIWKEANAEVIEIGLDNDGLFSLTDLEKQASNPNYAHRLKIGAFSAASNVTGIRSPIHDMARIMHQVGGLVFFDFAACGPYVTIELIQDNGDYFDGIYLSPHKFIGGPGSSGLLVFKKDIYNQAVGPTCAGGGTVEYVSSTDYDFVRDIERREDAGTPAIMQTLRTAIVLEIKQAIGVETIEGIEDHYIKRAIERISQQKNIEIIGPKQTDHRLGILSLSFKYKEHYLHPRYVTTLLNDLFGIQSRAGCSCAGPYGHLLLGIQPEKSDRYRDVIKSGCEAMKPGWVRVNFHYLLEEYGFDYILWALEFIAAYGYLFLSDYSVDSATGNWTNKLSHDETYEPFCAESILASRGFKPNRYDRQVTKQAYEKAKQEAMDLRDRYLLQHDETSLELFEQLKMKDLAWFYIKKQQFN